MVVKDDFIEYVYLRELDSVNKSYDEQVIAENALYNAIVYDGKSVILTYNQIVDSIALLHCIKDETVLNVLLEFFKDGKLLVNQYIEDMNISKYFQMNYHSKSFFQSSYFSFINKYPKDIQNNIYDGLNKSIQYGDSLYLKNHLPNIDKDDEIAILHYIKLILTINTYMYEYDCYVSPKPESELNGHRMKDYLERILNYLEEEQSIYFTHLKSLIQRHFSYQRSDTRSQYLDSLDVVPYEYKFTIIKMIDLAYNCALEYSILFVVGTDHLKQDIKKIMEVTTKDEDTSLAPIMYKWKEGYRVTSIATILHKRFRRLSWKWSLKVYPIVEVLRIVTSLLVAFMAMILIESLTSIQVFWQTYPIALLVTFVYNLILDELQEFVMGRLPEWLCGSGVIQQIKNFFKDICIVIGRDKI